MYKIETDTYEFKNLEERPVVYFATEYAISSDLPIYAGGLGVLAGDMFTEAAESGLPFVAIGFLYAGGFKVTNAPLTEIVDPLFSGFTLLKDKDGKEIEIDVPMKEGVYKAEVWQYKKNSAHLFLLDFDIEKNSEMMRAMTESLYPPEFEKKLTEEILLGIGGVALLQKLDIHPSIYHFNEGHTAFGLLALAGAQKVNFSTFQEALNALKPFSVLTKHTPLPDAGLFMTKTDIEMFLGPYLSTIKVSVDELFETAQSKRNPLVFSTTKFLLANCVRANAVSRMHELAERTLHPGSPLTFITNGVSQSRWQSDKLRDTKILRPDALWREHNEHKQALLDMVKKMTGKNLSPAALTIVWAKRFTPYKRPELLFAEKDKLMDIISSTDKPVQIIISGDANVSDSKALELLADLDTILKDEYLSQRIVYVPRYSMATAEILTKGADVWLNTPIPEKEACGTSGMKACLNGVLNLTTNGGWVAEAKHENIGWVLSEDNIEKRIYDLIENDIIPLYFERENNLPLRWIEKMKSAVGEIESHFLSKRMLGDYVSKLYFPNP